MKDYLEELALDGKNWDIVLYKTAEYFDARRQKITKNENNHLLRKTQVKKTICSLVHKPPKKTTKSGEFCVL